MFATSVRVRPGSARSSPRSVGRVTTSRPSSRSITMRVGTCCWSSPSGPATMTRPGSIVTLTLAGSSIGRLPILLMIHRSRGSPDVADDLAADPSFLGGLARDEPLGGGHDSRPHAAQYAGQLVLRRVDAAARTGYPLEVRDHAFAVAAVLQLDDEQVVAERRGRAVLALVVGALVDAVVGDVALLLEQPRD